VEAEGVRSDNGERLLCFGSARGWKVGGSLFKHSSIHKGTWRSTDGTTINQVDHFFISMKWAFSQPTSTERLCIYGFMALDKCFIITIQYNTIQYI